MIIKAKQAKESIWLESGGGKEEKKLFKSRSQLISVTTSVNCRVSGPLLQESEKGRKWEKWEEEGVWRRVLGQKSLGDYSPLSHV